MPLAIMLGNAGCSAVDAKSVPLVVDGLSIPLQGVLPRRGKLVVCDTLVLFSKVASSPISGCGLFVAAGTFHYGAQVSVGDQGQQKESRTIGHSAVHTHSEYGGSPMYTPAQWDPENWTGETSVGPADPCP